MTLIYLDGNSTSFNWLSYTICTLDWPDYYRKYGNAIRQRQNKVG